MALKNKSMYAILGILNISPSTGYDIKKYCDQVLSGFWNENFGHIYPTLKKLLDDGMIEIVSKEESERKIKYQITAKGKEELKTWLAEETLPQPVRSEFMLKLLFSSNQSEESVIYMLENYRKQYEDSVAKYITMQERLEKGIQDISTERACYLNAVLRRGIISGEAVIKWCNETIEDFKKMEG